MIRGGEKGTFASRSEPYVDYVLKFQGIPKRYAGGKRRVPQDVTKAHAVEFSALLESIRSLGLRCASRVGPADSGTVLVFVSATPELLEEMYAREKYVACAARCSLPGRTICCTACTTWTRQLPSLSHPCRAGLS